MMITKKCKIFTFIAVAGLLAALCYAQDPQTNANTRDIANLNSNVTVRLTTKVDKVHFSTYSANRQAEVNGKVNSVSATLPVVSSGGTTPVISLASVPFSNNSTGMRAVLAAKVPTSTTVNGQPLSGNVTVTTITGNAGTATALAANGTNCSSTQAAIGVDASGNAEGCFTPAGTYSLPTATASVLGGVKPDGTSVLNTAGVISATPGSVGSPSGSGTATGTNTGDVTIGTANGLSLAGQVLSLQAATNSVPGALTAADHTTLSTAVQPAGNVATATKWATGRTLSLTGDVTYTSPAIDGTGNVTAAATIAPGAANTKLFTNAAGTAREWATGMKTGYFSRGMTVASGTQAVTGVGFTPSTLIFLAVIDATNSTSYGIDDGGGTNANCIYNIMTGQSINAGQSISLYISAGVTYTGKIQSMDSSGFTIIWTRSGGPTGTAYIIYQAIR